MNKNIAISLGVLGCLILSTATYSKPNNIGVSNAAGHAFERIDLHKDIIKEANFVPKLDWRNTIQSGGTGLAEANVSGGGKIGSSQLQLQNKNAFGVGQLITYKGNNGQYYTAVITGKNGSAIRLKSPLEVSIANPKKIQNFYADPDHPNLYGYKAIADYAIRNLRNLNKGKHVLFGDSWFDHAPRHFSDRIAYSLPNANIINAGKGGNTTQNLLDRFDAAVTSQHPDVVWIMVGTNDYNRGVSKEAYARNIKKLIRKVNNIGARAIVFNSSVGKPLTHTKDGKRHPTPLDTMKVLSRDYYDALENMLN